MESNNGEEQIMGAGNENVSFASQVAIVTGAASGIAGHAMVVDGGQTTSGISAGQLRATPGLEEPVPPAF